METVGETNESPTAKKLVKQARQRLKQQPDAFSISPMEWMCSNCKKTNKPGETYCRNCFPEKYLDSNKATL